MNKRNKILIIILIILVIITAVLCFKVLKGDEEENTRDNLTKATTTLEERKQWNEFLNRNPYVSEIEMAESHLLDDTDIIKLAISSEDVETEYVVSEEIKKMPTLTKGDGFKKSKENIEEYAKKFFNKEKISYNFVETYLEGKQYLLMDENNVYFTKLELPDREYILMELIKEGNNFEALIYEYEVNENNKNDIEQMLESGNINTEIVKNKIYTITGIMNNEDICILTKE